MRDPETQSLPNNIEAELGFLGALLFDNRLAERVPDLRPDHFYDALCARVYALCLRMIRDGRRVDAVALRSAWVERDLLEPVGGDAFFVSVMNRAARLESNAVEYARIIRDSSLRRDLIAAAREVESLALRPPEGAIAADIAEEGERTLRAIALEDAPEAWLRIGDVTRQAVQTAKAGHARGISTGISGLDELTNGGGPGKLWIIAGATSMGKSIGGQEMALSVANQGRGVAYFHLEMDALEIGLRVASRFAWHQDGVGLNRLDGNPAYLDAARGKLTQRQWQAMEGAAEQTSALPVWLDTTPGLTLPQIETRARRLMGDMRRAGVEPGLVVIDHQGLVANHERHASELESARARGNELKGIAKRLNVWTTALAQITKDGAGKDGEDRLPTLDDIAYGGGLTQAADAVILLHRRAYYAERKPAHIRTDQDIANLRSLVATLIIDKARGGRRGKVEAIMDVASSLLRDAQAGELEQ